MTQQILIAVAALFLTSCAEKNNENKEGKFVIPLQFSRAHDFSEGLAGVLVGDEQIGRAHV